MIILLYVYIYVCVCVHACAFRVQKTLPDSQEPEGIGGCEQNIKNKDITLTDGRDQEVT